MTEINSKLEAELLSEPAEKKKVIFKAVAIIILSVWLAVSLALCIHFFVFAAMLVDGQSMEPNIHHKNMIFVLKLGYSLEYGDIVVFKNESSKMPPIKRIIARGGDTVELFDGDVYLNGEILDESGYGITDFTYKSYESYQTKWILQEDELFVLGDNRKVSRDSRAYGPISLDAVIGKVVFVL